MATQTTKKTSTSATATKGTKAGKPTSPISNGNGHVTQLKSLQYKILVALTGGKMLTRKEIADACCNGNSVNLAPYLGATDANSRPEREAKAGFPSLLTLKLVTEKAIDLGDGKMSSTVSITAAGKKAVEKGIQDPRLPKVGTIIEREYKGKTYHVEVLPDGFKMGKETFNSLSKVAKIIIGSDTEINGFAFFNLTKPKE